MAISGRAKVFGVFGHPVGHSQSPAMHNAAIAALRLDAVYVPFDVAPQDLRQALDGVRALGISGVNVTIPHKEAVIPFLDEVEPETREFGSVNTIANVGGRLIGSSTDGPGFLRSIRESGFEPEGRTAVVLGAGGAGRAVSFALARSGATVVLFDEATDRAERLAADVAGITGSGVAASETDGKRLADRIRSADLLVNCTPVGMSPRDGDIPVDPELLRPGLFVYDLVYNPLKTRLLAAAEAVGAKAVSGVKMLVYQGAISFKTWTGVEPPTDVMEDAVRVQSVKCRV